MLAEADYYAAGQKLKLKATAAMAVLNEALQYLVENTFTKMGYLKVLCQEPLKEIQAIIRSNDIGTQMLALNLIIRLLCRRVEQTSATALRLAVPSKWMFRKDRRGPVSAHRGSCRHQGVGLQLWV